MSLFSQDLMEASKEHLLYLIDVHIFQPDDIRLNTATLAWPDKMKPVFEQNTEIVEDCKAREGRKEGRRGEKIWPIYTYGI